MKIRKINRIKNIYILFILLIFIQSYFYIEHIFNKYKLLNEYKYFDEITLLNDKEVSNFEYINKNLIFKPKELGEYKYSSKNILFKDKNHKGFNFNNYPKYIILDSFEINSYKDLLKEYNSTFSQILFSKDKNKTWCEYLNDLNDLNILNNLNKSKIKNSFIEKDFKYYPLFIAPTKQKLREKMEFIKANIYEQNMQIFDRYYIHENSFVLCPINSMELGKPYNLIFSQYGYLSVKLIAWIMKLYGGISINNYEKAKKTIDLIYFIFAIIFIFLFFKDNFLRLGFILFLGIGLFGNSFYFFNYAPDTTNFKHLLDLSIILLLFLYKKHNNILYFIGSLIFGLTSIYLNKEFGLFVYLSLIAVITYNIYIFYIKECFNYKEIIFSIIFIILGIILIIKYPLMKNPSFQYFLDGFYAFPFKTKLLLYSIIFYIFFLWVLFYLFYKKISCSQYFFSFIYILFYIEFIMSYIVWHGLGKDLFFYSYILALPSMIIYDIFNFKHKNKISIIILIILSIIYCNLLINFIKGKKRYEYVIKTHKLYKWNHPRAEILSTYSFEPFKDSIKLIKEYNPSKEFFMISKYDNILAFLSQKYSGYPFFELRSTIVTKRDYEIIKNIILKKANILFVDNDINRNFNKEIKKHNFFNIYDEFYENDNLKQRIPKLKILQRLWNEVKEHYILVKKGKLISVYKKIK